MAVTSITERFDKRRSPAEWNGRNYSRRHTRAFTVLTDDFNDGPQAARLADLSTSEPSGKRIPRIGEPHPKDLTALCVATVPLPIKDDPLAFEVLCGYITAPSSATGGHAPSERMAKDPLARPFTYSISSVRVQVVATKDVDGFPIETTAGEPFDPPIEEEESRTVLVVTKNLPVSGTVQEMLSDINEIEGTINEFAWGGVMAHQAKLVDVGADLTFEEGIKFWAMRYEIHLLHGSYTARNGEVFANPTWDRVILNQGFMEKTFQGANGLISVDIIDPSTGRTVTSPVKLNVDGTRLPPDEDPVYVLFQTKRHISFDGLGLG